jgi:hypothetical protein
MLGLHRNVLTWDGEQLATWLDALGLGELAPNFLAHNVDGETASPPPPTRAAGDVMRRAHATVRGQPCPVSAA